MGFRQVVGVPGFAGEYKSFVAEGYQPCSIGTHPLAAGKTDACEGNRAGVHLRIPAAKQKIGTTSISFATT
ncbi:hypothetical protein [Niabella hibiscisoli]|uniref:hypothetical protein n=1 Tax=Niabella hibiscisoli TaxID=1825928 RepID=UPI001F10A6DA|nr:hypothetical protein [Niabella hibiscisoli]MCH5718264.1 hypothetical protein [Niabella hibiscisoli]